MILALLIAAATIEPTTTGQDLRSQIMAADDVLFERSFNECVLGALRGILTPDAEMIHDQAGNIKGREAFIEPIRKIFAMAAPRNQFANALIRASIYIRYMKAIDFMARSNKGSTNFICARRVSRLS